MGLEEAKTADVRLRWDRPLLISFSGIDGAGKTTQIENLKDWLSQAGIQVELIRFWDDVALLRQFREWAGRKLFRGDEGIGTPERPVARRDKNVRNWYTPALRLFLCSLDAVGLTIAVAKLRLRRAAAVIVFDRYLYDQLANLNLENRGVKNVVRVVLRLTPRPTIPCLLDADPVLARARKPEYPIDFLRQNRQSYLVLAEMAEMAVVSAGSTEEVTRNVRRAIMSKVKRAQDHSNEILPVGRA
jgi:thymidylate kinase